MKKLNCLLVHNGLKKCSPQMQEHLPHCKQFSPNSQPLWLWLYPRSLQLAKTSPVPYLGVISCFRQKAVSVYLNTCTHTPLLCVSLNLREIQDAFIQDSSVQFSCDLCDMGPKGRRIEGRALSDYYHHYDFHNSCFLLTGMILFELCSVFSTAPVHKRILPSLLGRGIRWHKRLGNHCLKTVCFSTQCQQEHRHKSLWQLSRHWRGYIWNQLLKNKQEPIEQEMLPGERSVQNDNGNWCPRCCPSNSGPRGFNSWWVV